MGKKFICVGFRSSVVLAIAIALTSPRLVAQTAAEPDKAAMIETLNTVCDLLETGKTDELEAFIYLPPEFKPEMFDVLLKRNVISRDGVLALEKAGTFGTAAAIYGDKRAAGRTADAGAPVEECYAMTMEQGEESCNVIAHWTDGQFRIVDMNRIGSMVSANAVAKVEMPIVDWPIGTAPTKELLLQSLTVLLGYIENEQYDAAKPQMYVPEDFPADKFARLIELRELSPAGIEVLRETGVYGPAVEVFEADRANHFAQRVDVPVNECFGMVAVAEGEQGETMAHWVGDRFKFLRADDIGKLAPESVEKDVPEMAEPAVE